MIPFLIHELTIFFPSPLTYSLQSLVKMPVKPTSFVEGQWRRLLSNERLRRSSQVVSVVDQTVCIFGGEVQPRQPVDNQIDVFSLTSGIALSITTNTVLKLSQK